MLNIDNTSYTIRTGSGNTRITKTKRGVKPYGQRRVKPVGLKGKFVSAVVSTYVDSKIYKALDTASGLTGKSHAQIIRQGLIREIGAIIVANELKLDMSLFAVKDPQASVISPNAIKHYRHEISELKSKLAASNAKLEKLTTKIKNVIA